jgi:hypothetical protein
VCENWEFHPKELPMRDKNTFAKRQQEIRKKQKAQDKQARRRKRKEQSGGANGPDDAGHGADRPET